VPLGCSASSARFGTGCSFKASPGPTDEPADGTGGPLSRSPGTPVSERIVAATMARPVSSSAAQNIRGVADSPALAQRSLVDRGANIGRTILTVADSNTGDPLYVSADDRLWGYSSEWISPLVQGLPGFDLSGPPVGGSSSLPPVSTSGLTGSATGPPAWAPPFSAPPPQR
jgi:hypothetical protein